MSNFWRRTPLKPPASGKPAPIARAPALSASARRRQRLLRPLKAEVEELKRFLVEVNPINA